MALLALQADLEKFLQVDVSAEPDAAITAYLQAASAIVESYCGRIFTSGTVTAELHDGDTRTLYLRQPPVTAVAAVVENGVALAATDFLFYPDGRLIRLSGESLYRWYPKLQTVAVTYTGGYGTAAAGTIPHDVRDVTVRIAARAFQAGAAYAAAPASAAAVKSVTLAGSDSVTYSDAVTGSVATAAVQLTDDDKRALDPYRILNIA